MSNWSFVMLAYGLSWVVLAGYAVLLIGKHRQAREAMEKALQAQEVEP